MIYVFFSKFFRKLKLQSSSQNLKFPTLLLGAVRLLSRVANLAFKYVVQPCSSRDMTCGAVRVNSKVANRLSMCDCSNPFGFRDTAFCMIS